MSAETKKLPKTEGFYAWREIGSKEYAASIAKVTSESGVLSVIFLGSDMERPVNIKACTKRWWFKLPSQNLGS